MEEKQKILVVEDLKHESEYIQLKLGALGYEVCGSTTFGEEAVELALKTAPDLVLMDIILSGDMDGIEAAEHIQQSVNIPIVYLTAYADEPLLNRAKITVPYGYLLKPFEQRELHCAVEVALYKHKVEKEIREQRELYSITLSSITEAIITTDRHGLITNINPVAELLTGWSSRDAFGRAMEDVFHVVEEKTKESIDGITVPDSLLIKKDGSKIPIEKNAAPIYDDKGNVYGFVTVFNDITDRLRREEESFKAQKLESMGLFARRVAHDFNDQLTVIMGNISLTQLYHKEEDIEYERLKDAENACSRAKELTDELLSFARVGTPFKVASSIKDVVVISANEALAGSAIRCEFGFPDNLWPVEFDERQLNMAIKNIVKNSDEAMPEGGVIKIRAENILVDQDSGLICGHGRYVRVEIEDEGVGISQEHLAKIFDPYFSTKQKGSGMGLATVYSIIKNHQGYIGVDSKPGAGTRVDLYLPAADPTDCEEEKPIETNGVVEAGVRVLVMDDDEAIRDVIEEMLTFLGYEPSFAHEGSKAIELFKGARAKGEDYSLVIMDLTVVKGMGGLEATRNLLEIDPGVKVIVSSGYSNDPVMGDYTKNGFKDVVSKPYKLEDLDAAIKRVLRMK